MIVWMIKIALKKSKPSFAYLRKQEVIVERDTILVNKETQNKKQNFIREILFFVLFEKDVFSRFKLIGLVAYYSRCFNGCFDFVPCFFALVLPF